MDAQQFQKEIEKLQMQMVEAQAKYTANPTDENLMKMQKELEALSMKMNQLSLQYSGSSQDISQLYAEAASGGFEIEISTDGLFDEVDLEAFVKENPPPKGKEKYLPIGGVLIATHYEPWQTFAMTTDGDYWMSVLEGGWDIDNVKEGKKMLASLLEGRHYAKFGEDFRKFVAGKPHELDEDSVENYEYTLEALEEFMPNLLATAKKCDNIMAWDLERVGYLARIFRQLGWISDSELFEWLEKTAEKIKAQYPGWNEYILSVIIGRAVAYSFDIEVIEAAEEILVDGKNALKTYPLSSL